MERGEVRHASFLGQSKGDKKNHPIRDLLPENLYAIIPRKGNMSNNLNFAWNKLLLVLGKESLDGAR